MEWTTKCQIESLKVRDCGAGTNFYIGYNVHFPEYFESTNGHPGHKQYKNKHSCFS